MKEKLFWDFLEDKVKMETTGFLADIMLHLNDLNVKRLGKNHLVFNLISTIHAFQKNWNCLLLIFDVNFSTFANFWSNVKTILI